jgi:hypothetical protein
MGWLLGLIFDFVMVSLPPRIWFGCMGVMILFLAILFGSHWYMG